MIPLSPADLALDRHTFFLVHPFRGKLLLNDGAMPWRVRDKWLPYTSRLSPTALAREMDDSFAFLPFVRPRIFAEMTEVERSSKGTDYSHVEQAVIDTACIRGHRSYARNLNATRLTLSSNRISAYAPLAATIYKADGTTFPVPLTCSWIDVVLFPPSTGFLILKLETVGLTMQEAGQVHRSLKKVFFRERLRVRPAKIEFRDGHTDYWADSIPRLLDSLLLDRYNLSHVQTVGSSFRVLSAAMAHNLHDDGNVYGNIKGSYEGHLMSLITGEDLGGVAHPGVELMSLVREEGLIRYFENWAGLILWDDLALLADATPFSTKHLWHTIEALYLPVYVLTLFQQMRLQEIAGDLAAFSETSNLRQRHQLKTLQQLNQELLEFRNRFLFAEISRAPVLAALYARFKKHFHIDELYSGIESELERLYTQERTMSQDRMSVLVSFVTFVALPLTFLLGTFGEVLKKYVPTDPKIAVLATLGVGVVSTLVWLAYTGRLTRRK